MWNGRCNVTIFQLVSRFALPQQADCCGAVSRVGELLADLK
jgi:hypothetical protein